MDNNRGVYIFKYRSRDALKSELIIPRSPSPEPASNPLRQRSHNSNNIGLSAQDRIAALERELAAVKAEANIKDECQEPGSRKRNRQDDKIPRSGKVYKTTQKRNGNVVVDLTDDKTSRNFGVSANRMRSPFLVSFASIILGYFLEADF